MKKYLIILAAVSMAIGGAINFAGCAPDGSELSGDTISGEEGKKEEDLEKGAGGPPTGAPPEPTGDVPAEKPAEKPDDK